MTDNTVEIVITASRLTGASTYQLLPAWIDYWSTVPVTLKDSQWQYGPYTDQVEDKTSDNHLKKVVILGSIANFIAELDSLKGAVSLLPANQIIQIGLGYTMTAGQLLAKIDGLRFQIFDKQFAGPGYGGANYGDRIEIDWRTFAGYTARGSIGVTYLVLHEIAHNTELGLMTRSWMTNAHRDAGSIGFYGQGNLFFERQERYANTIARNMANSIGRDLSLPNEPNFPPYGFEPL